MIKTLYRDPGPLLQMNKTLFLYFPMLALCCLLPACGDKTAEQATGETSANTVGNFNMDSMSTMASDLATKLGDIKDLPSAKAISDKVAPMLDQLAEAKGKIDMQGLVESAKALRTRFASKEKILLAMKPLLDRISNLGK